MNACSLLIPCHNAAQYLPRLWETVQAQTVPFDEIICYDDGSTDNTAEVVRLLGLKLIQGEPRRGVAFARNQLALAATSTWIHFHDADDILDPGYLEHSKSQIRDDIDVVVCSADWIDETYRNLMIARRYSQQELDTDPVRSALTNPIGIISCLYRKDRFLAINGFNESLACWEDGDLHVRLAANGARFAVVDEVLSFSLRHNRGLSSDQLLCHHCHLRLLEEYARQFSPSMSPVIATEAEKLASQLLLKGDWKAAIRAIELCKTLGKLPPTTHNPLLKVLKPFVPCVFVLYLQSRLRQSNLVKAKEQPSLIGG